MSSRSPSQSRPGRISRFVTLFRILPTQELGSACFFPQHFVSPSLQSLRRPNRRLTSARETVRVSTASRLTTRVSLRPGCRSLGRRPYWRFPIPEAPGRTERDCELPGYPSPLRRFPAEATESSCLGHCPLGYDKRTPTCAPVQVLSP